MKSEMYYDITKTVSYHKNEYFSGENAMFTIFNYDEKIISSGLDKELVQTISGIISQLNKQKDDFLIDKADRIYFYKNFPLVCLINSKYPNTGYSIKINLNLINFKVEKKRFCLVS